MSKSFSITIKDYFKYVHSDYVYLKIIPNTSIRNYNTSLIANTISLTYKSIVKRVHIEQKKLFFETNYKITYIIDISKNNIQFYFLVPEVFKNIIREKIESTWNKCTISEVDDIKEPNKNIVSYQLGYKKDDALSLKIDKRTNEPLNNILNVAKIMQDDDRVVIAYNFMPCSQGGWIEHYNSMLKKFEDRKPLEKHISISYVFKIVLNLAIDTIDMLFEMLSDFLGSDKFNSNELYKRIMIAFEEKTVLSSNTTTKKDSRIIQTQIAVISQSENTNRRNNNAISVCNSFNSIKDDNELIYKKIKKKFKLNDYSFKTWKNYCSTDECKNFIQLPGYELIKELSLDAVRTLQNNIPKKLSNGYITLGKSTYKGIKIDSYFEDEYNISSFPLCLVGAQNSGKSTYAANYFKYVSQRNEGGVVIDFIKSCKLSDEIKSYISPDKIIDLNLSDTKDMQAFVFNENSCINLEGFKKVEMANLQAQMIANFIDSVNSLQPLQGRMRRYLISSATISILVGKSAIKDVVRCLEDFNTRLRYISKIKENDKEYILEEIEDLKALNEVDKNNKVIGTKESKIEGILDRIAVLRSDIKLKYMYNKSGEKNLNLVDELNKGKIILFRMKQSLFKERTKNVITTFLLSKIWSATEIRGSMYDKPLKSHILIDEPFQTKTAIKMLSDDEILPQTRKFGCRFIFTCQYLEQIQILLNTLMGAGSSFMFLNGTLEQDIKLFENRLGEYSYNDIKNMKAHNSLNSIYYSDGYANFITQLPPPKRSQD